jgi:glycolate oxidase subunit GlcD
MEQPIPFKIGDDTITEINNIAGDDNVITDRDMLKKYDRDASFLRSIPQVMVMARSTEQISRLLKLANIKKFPVVPRAGGTGLAGGCLPIFGGVVLNLSSMNRIRAVDTGNLIADVEPGVITLDLRNAAKEKGLFYPPDPAGMDKSTIGGNAATSAGGPSCLKYGTTKDYVLGLEVVLPRGEIMTTGTRTRKGVVGYDLTHLLVGSEGTLGIITGLILKLIPHPPASKTLGAVFHDIRDAMTAVTQIQVRGHLPAALEFMDAKCLGLVRDLISFSIPGENAAFVIIEVDGAEEQTKTSLADIGMILREMGASELLEARDESQRENIWSVRRQISIRIREASVINIAEDIAVPIGRIADLVSAMPDIEKKSGVSLYAFGHAGDGNIHINITAPEKDHPDLDSVIRNVLKTTVAMGGTISGEHGIGYAKKSFLDLELSPTSISLQKGIKRLFDPNDILNPGKIF